MLEERQIEQNKEAFIYLFKSYLTDRQGSVALLDWLLSTTFFTDPASSKYHEAYPGGLCEHTLKVYDNIFDIANIMTNGEFQSQSLTIVSLFHDICKIGCYKKSFRNVKTYDKEEVEKATKWQIKNDALGNFIWKSEESYIFEDDFPMGHGEKSVYLVERFMKLTDDEALAIRWHMGAWEDGDKRPLSSAFERCKLAVLLHMADTSATYLPPVVLNLEEY